MLGSMDMPTGSAPPRRTIATPQGNAKLIDEIVVPSSFGPEDELVLQRLETSDGPLLRAGYRRAGRMLRGPVSATPEEVSELLRAATRSSSLSQVLPCHGK
jgi:hypothetical protein